MKARKQTSSREGRNSVDGPRAVEIGPCAPLRSPLDLPTLVLNRNWLAINITTARRAMVLLSRGVARAILPNTYEVLAFDDWLLQPVSHHANTLRSVGGPIPIPEVILLDTYDRVPRRTVPYTRRNLLKRDGGACQYCGRRVPPNEVSIDHVFPRSRGGASSWQNCVLACRRCNVTKGNRTPKEAGMRLLRAPREPKWTPYCSLSKREENPIWCRFVID